MRRLRTVLPLLASICSGGFVSAQDIGDPKLAPGTEVAPGSTPPAPAPQPAPATAAPTPRIGGDSPFRLGLTYSHVIEEDGDLVNNSRATNAFGLDLVSPSSSYVRDHLGLAYQWESSEGYSARGFRIDLISFGYPIHLDDSPKFRLDLEPILTLVRGEIMFVTGGKFLRMESGFGLELAATWNHWFVDVQPFAIDFRYWIYSSNAPTSRTGLGRIFPFRLVIGHEF